MALELTCTLALADEPPLGSATPATPATPEPPAAPLLSATPEPPAAPQPPAPPAPSTTAPDADAVANDRLGRFLGVAAAEARRGRTVGAIFDTVMAAVTLPTGIVLATRGEPGAEAVGVMVTVQGAEYVISLIDTTRTSSMDRLREHWALRMAAGETPAAVVAETEDEWQRAAHESRHAWDVVGLTLAAAELAIGGYFLLDNPGPPSRAQTDVGALFVAVSVPGIAAFTGSLLSQPPAAVWWRRYVDTRPGPTAIVWAPSLRVAPTPGGATGAVRFDF